MQIVNYTKMDKKAQMKIQQMAFMLLAVFLFFALIGMVFISFKLSGLKEAAAILEEKNAMFLVSKISNSPEFSCGQSFGTTKTNCIDMDKAMALKKNINNYVSFWGVENIEIRKIYPDLGEIVCDSGNYPDCSLLRILSGDSSGIGISSFVALCRIEQGESKCELGKIIIIY